MISCTVLNVKRKVRIDIRRVVTANILEIRGIDL